MKNHSSALALAAVLSASPAIAHDVKADDHAPIGVMGDHTHEKGEVMISVRYMHMAMSENQIGTDGVTPDTIVTTIPNRFFGAPMQPPTLRIVPTEMNTDMVMIGAMYAPADWVTLMAMGSYITKDMSHITYQGGMGTTPLGTFETSPEGFGDISVGALFPVMKNGDRTSKSRQEMTVGASVSIPTGSTTETAQILSPMNAEPTVRTPYMMQIGSGTWDIKPSATFKGWDGKLGYGVQYAGTIRTGTNDEGYSFGDVHEGSVWVSYNAKQWISFSARTRARTTGRVDGIDPMIMGPVQTANPDFQGGERIDVLGGINLVATHGPLAGHRIGLEVGAPIYQNLNGPQMAGDWSLNVGWQKAF
ncbi:transporter [Altererythrobacter sp. ZODW24]|uniref:transporter n=1 Tax=Altererythrobacter sp. ZODW24 TaxID=2185142 RepID=UPI000DF7D212|nr:transporter [Altererythrobacter sp. ZODW24]